MPITDMSNQFDQLFFEKGKEYGVDPMILKGIASVESNFNPKAVGPKTRSGNAQGMMQFIPAMQKPYGITDPFDPEQSVAGSARMMRDLLKRYKGDVGKALEAYNGGPRLVGKSTQTRVYAEKVQRKAQLFAKSTQKPAIEVAGTATQGPSALSRTPQVSQQTPKFNAKPKTGELTASLDDLGNEYKAAIALTYLSEDDDDGLTVTERAEQMLADQEEDSSIRGDALSQIFMMEPTETEEASPFDIYAAAQNPQKFSEGGFAIGGTSLPGMPNVALNQLRYMTPEVKALMESIEPLNKKYEEDFKKYETDATAYNRGVEEYNKAYKDWETRANAYNQAVEGLGQKERNYNQYVNVYNEYMLERPDAPSFEEWAKNPVIPGDAEATRIAQFKLGRDPGKPDSTVNPFPGDPDSWVSGLPTKPAEWKGTFTGTAPTAPELGYDPKQYEEKFGPLRAAQEDNEKYGKQRQLALEVFNDPSAYNLSGFGMAAGGPVIKMATGGDTNVMARLLNQFDQYMADNQLLKAQILLDDTVDRYGMNKDESYRNMADYVSSKYKNVFPNGVSAGQLLQNRTSLQPFRDYVNTTFQEVLGRPVGEVGTVYWTETLYGQLGGATASQNMPGGVVSVDNLRRVASSLPSQIANGATGVADQYNANKWFASQGRSNRFDISKTLPSDWASYTPDQKIAWYNSNSVTPEMLTSVGVPQADIDWMSQRGYTGGTSTAPAPITDPKKAEYDALIKNTFKSVLGRDVVVGAEGYNFYLNELMTGKIKPNDLATTIAYGSNNDVDKMAANNWAKTNLGKTIFDIGNTGKETITVGGDSAKTPGGGIVVNPGAVENIPLPKPTSPGTGTVTVGGSGNVGPNLPETKPVPVGPVTVTPGGDKPIFGGPWTPPPANNPGQNYQMKAPVIPNLSYGQASNATAKVPVFQVPGSAGYGQASNTAAKVPIILPAMKEGGDPRTAMERVRDFLQAMDVTPLDALYATGRAGAGAAFGLIPSSLNEGEDELLARYRAMAERLRSTPQPPMARSNGSPPYGEDVDMQMFGSTGDRSMDEAKKGFGRSVDAIRRGVQYSPADLLGAPVDVINMGLQPFGLGSEKPFMGSEYLIDKGVQAGIYEKPTGEGEETLARFAAGMINPTLGPRAIGKVAQGIETLGGTPPKGAVTLADQVANVELKTNIFRRSDDKPFVGELESLLQGLGKEKVTPLEVRQLVTQYKESLGSKMERRKRRVLEERIDEIFENRDPNTPIDLVEIYSDLERTSPKRFTQEILGPEYFASRVRHNINLSENIDNPYKNEKPLGVTTILFDAPKGVEDLGGLIYDLDRSANGLQDTFQFIGGDRQINSLALLQQRVNDLEQIMPSSQLSNLKAKVNDALDQMPELQKLTRHLNDAAVARPKSAELDAVESSVRRDFPDLFGDSTTAQLFNYSRGGPYADLGGPEQAMSALAVGRATHRKVLRGLINFEKELVQQGKINDTIRSEIELAKFKLGKSGSAGINEFDEAALYHKGDDGLPNPDEGFQTLRREVLVPVLKSYQAGVGNEIFRTVRNAADKVVEEGNKLVPFGQARGDVVFHEMNRKGRNAQQLGFTRFVEFEPTDTIARPYTDNVSLTAPSRVPVYDFPQSKKGAIFATELQSDMRRGVAEGTRPFETPFNLKNQEALRDLLIKNMVDVAVKRDRDLVLFPSSDSTQPQLYENLHKFVETTAKDLGPNFKAVEVMTVNGEGERVVRSGIFITPEGEKEILEKGLKFAKGGMVDKPLYDRAA